MLARAGAVGLKFKYALSGRRNLRRCALFRRPDSPPGHR